MTTVHSSTLPRKLAFPFAVVTMGMVMLLLLAGICYAMFPPMAAWLTKEEFSFDLVNRKVVLTLIAVGLSTGVMCYGYYVISTRPVSATYARFAWTASAAYQGGLTWLLVFLVHGTVEVKSALPLPAVPFWLLSLTMACFSAVFAVKYFRQPSTDS